MLTTRNPANKPSMRIRGHLYNKQVSRDLRLKHTHTHNLTLYWSANKGELVKGARDGNRALWECGPENKTVVERS